MTRRLLLACLLAGCGAGGRSPGASDADVSPVLDRIAETYVQLVLALGQHDPTYVTAYAGSIEGEPRSLGELRFAALPLVAQLEALEPGGAEGDERLRERRDHLLSQLQALAARAEMLDGIRFTFDDEVALFYDIEPPPSVSEHQLEEAAARVAAGLPGHGTLADRVASYRRLSLVPPERLDAALRAALDEARRRTAATLGLPPSETVEIEYVDSAPWPAATVYEGDGRSRIVVAKNLPFTVDEIFEIATAHGYPGRHAAAVLRDTGLVRGRGWIEYGVSARYTPRAFVDDGLAAFAAEVVFPGDERLAFERDVLFPLAGLDPALAADHPNVHTLLRELDPAAVEAVRRYVDGALTEDGVTSWLSARAGLPLEAAGFRAQSMGTYRDRVLGEVLGRELVRARIEAGGGTADRPDRRWALFQELIMEPVLLAASRGDR